jgi:predicted dehydrogenase
MDINRILIVGSGNIAQRHKAIAENNFPNAEIAFLTRNNDFQKKFYKNTYINNIEDALKFLPQISVIANAAPFHIETAKKLAMIGSNILLEKPLSDNFNLLKINSLLNILERSSNILILGYNMRFLKSLQFFRKKLLNNEIGKPLSFRCEAGQYLPDWRPNIDYRKSVSAKRKLGGGVLLELSHELDYISWIFGHLNWVSSTLSKQSFLDVDVEDTVHAIIGINNEAQNSELIGSLNLDFIRRDKSRSCLVIGENGSLRWDGIKFLVEIYDSNNHKWVKLFQSKDDMNNSYHRQWKHFINCIKYKKKPIVTVVDGIMTLKSIEAIRKSSNLKKQIKISR